MRPSWNREKMIKEHYPEHVQLRSAASEASAPGSSLELPASADTRSDVSPATPTLQDVLSRLQPQSSQPGAEKLSPDEERLLQDIPVLQKWNDGGTNKDRDAMLKLGKHYGVPQNAGGKKRPPATVAKELQEKMLKKASPNLLSVDSLLNARKSAEKFEILEGLSLLDTSTTTRLRDLHRKIKVLQADLPPGLTRDVLEGIPLLLAWKIVWHPTHAVRNAMLKHAKEVWRIQRAINQFEDSKRVFRLRPLGDIAAELEERLLPSATELLNGSQDKHAH